MCQDPDRPSLESRPMRFFCIGFRYGNDVAICINLYLRGCIIHFRKYGLPYGLSVSLCTLHLMVTHFDATLDMGGWLDLTQQELSPCKKYRASWRSSAKSYRIICPYLLFIYFFIQLKKVSNYLASKTLSVTLYCQKTVPMTLKKIGSKLSYFK